MAKIYDFNKIEVDLEAIPYHVVVSFMTEANGFRASPLYKGKLATEEEMKPYVADLKQVEAVKLWQFVQRKSSQSTKSSGVRSLEAAHIKHGGLQYKEIGARVLAFGGPVIDDLKKEPTGERVGAIYRGVPIIEDKLPIIEHAQSVAELPFTFVEVSEQMGKETTVVVNTSLQYQTGVKICYNLGHEFLTDMCQLMRRIIKMVSGDMTEKFGTDPVRNSQIFIAKLYETPSNLVSFAIQISNALFLHSSDRVKKTHFAKVDSSWVTGKTIPIMWTKSFAFPKVQEIAVQDFKTYTKYMNMFLEVRSKGDRYSDKVYRMPISDYAQQHVENVIRLRDSIKREILVVGHDSGTLIKIAWAIYHHRIDDVKVQHPLLPGNGNLLKDILQVTPRPTQVIFRAEISQVTSLMNEKLKTDAEFWKRITEAHDLALSHLLLNHATVIKSFYYPPVDGITYVESSEPHNGSVIVFRHALPIEAPMIPRDSFALDFQAAQRFRMMAFTSSMAKTMFAICREKIWQVLPLRYPMNTGPPLSTELLPLDVRPDDEEEKMRFLEKPQDVIYGTTEKDEDSYSRSEEEDDGTEDEGDAYYHEQEQLQREDEFRKEELARMAAEDLKKRQDKVKRESVVEQKRETVAEPTLEEKRKKQLEAQEARRAQELQLKAQQDLLHQALKEDKDRVSQAKKVHPEKEKRGQQTLMKERDEPEKEKSRKGQQNFVKNKDEQNIYEGLPSLMGDAE